jgi:non-ribosomal peptide synthetase component E (peptide arylation enzyme)
LFRQLAYNRRAVVRIHAHARLLGVLSNEDMHNYSLRCFGKLRIPFVTSIIAIMHASVTDVSSELIHRENHIDRSSVVPEQ